jgi:hypothetical protein
MSWQAVVGAHIFPRSSGHSFANADQLEGREAIGRAIGRRNSFLTFGEDTGATKALRSLSLKPSTSVVAQTFSAAACAFGASMRCGSPSGLPSLKLVTVKRGMIGLFLKVDLFSLRAAQPSKSSA